MKIQRDLIMLDKLTFCAALQKIKLQEEIDARFSKALEEVGNGHFVYGTENKYKSALLDVLKAAMNDKYDYIEWWLYETDNYTVTETVNGKETCFDLTSPQSLYEYLNSHHP